MDLLMRAIQPEEFNAFIAEMDRNFAEASEPADVDAIRGIAEYDRSLAVFDAGAIVATSGVFTFTTTAPGGAAVPTAGVTWVTVRATHRRRGLLTRMMRQMLESAHERGEPIASLWASESLIYPRFGYGLAMRVASFKIETRHSRFADERPATGTIRLVDVAEAAPAMAAVYATQLSQRPGLRSRSQASWTAFCHDFSQSKASNGARQYALHEVDGSPDGYIVFRNKGDWSDDGFPGGRLTVIEHMAANPAAGRDLWRFILDIDLVTNVQVGHRPVDEVLPFLFADHRRARMELSDGVWARLLDVPAALAARRYTIEDRIVLEVADDFCPWVAGTYALSGGPDGASCQATTASADLRLHSRDLSAAYMGGTSFATLAAAGKVEEVTTGALTRAGRMFGWHQAPWPAETF